MRPGEPDGRNRADISVGAEVDIVLKADQGTGRLTRGVVREFLTNSKHHPQGIKVRLVDGAIGRVKRVVSGGGGGGARAAETASGRPRGSATSATSSTNRTNRTCDASSSSSSSSSSSREPNGDVSTSEDPPRGAPSTVYLSNIPKALSKADVRWLVEEIPGVPGLRLPRRGGKNMGYSFITCDGEAAASAVIAAVHGMELEGKALVAERARTETRSGGEDDSGPSRSDGRDGKKAASRDGNENKKKRKRGKQWKREEEEEEEEEDAADPIAAARAEMEAEAILELERAKRAVKKQMEAAEAVAAERRAKEAAAEARTTAMLAERQRRAEAAASAAAAKRDREEAVRREAVALGPIVVDPQWETELLELAEELAALRASVE